MSILKIARMGHPVLSMPAEEVADPTSRAVHELIEDMIETMIDANGAGLAAPQVHVSQRVVVLQSGRVVEQGEYDELAKPGTAFCALLAEAAG